MGFGSSSYGFSSKDMLVSVYTQEGTAHLASIDIQHQILREIETPYTSIWGLRVKGEDVYFGGGSPVEAPALMSSKPIFG